MVCTELANYFGGIAMLAVYRFIHRAHVIGGDFAGKGVESVRDLRPATERFVTHQRNSLVRREVVAIILKRDEPECLDRAVG